MYIDLTNDQERSCPCGAAISENERGELCKKCSARACWERREAGRLRRNGGDQR